MSKKGCVIFLSGLPCSGKSTISTKLYEYLLSNNIPSIHYDGDSFRQLYCTDLGFSKEDRIENVSRLAIRAMCAELDGLVVLCSFVAPYRELRENVRTMCNNFIEVHVHADKQTCMDRDVKGMWKKAVEGEIKNFTGYSAPYEEPINPEVICFTAEETIEESTTKIIKYLKNIKLL